MDDFSIFWNLVSHFTELRNTIQRSWWFIGYGSPSTRIWLALTTTQHALLNIHLNPVRNVSVCFYVSCCCDVMSYWQWSFCRTWYVHPISSYNCYSTLYIYTYWIIFTVFVYYITHLTIRPSIHAIHLYSLLKTHPFQACRKSGIMALDVDVVECHGSGRFIADAIEANDDSMGI